MLDGDVTDATGKPYVHPLNARQLFGLIVQRMGASLKSRQNFSTSKPRGWCHASSDTGYILLSPAASRCA
eukprot:6189805-Pleurochrysis_carterae.AAC.4